MEDIRAPLSIDGNAMANRIEQLTHVILQLSEKIDKHNVAITSTAGVAPGSSLGYIPQPPQIPLDVLPNEHELIPVSTIENMEILDEKLGTDESFRTNLVSVFIFRQKLNSKFLKIYRSTIYVTSVSSPTFPSTR